MHTLCRSTNRTTIDANGETYTVTFATNAGMTTRIENFVITGATASGIQIIGNSTHQPTPIVAGCIIEQNQATLGGGIYVEYASPTITGNRILNNTASGAGGGIYAIGASNGSEPVIADNLIEGNVAGGTGGGGGIYSFQTNPSILNNTFIRNSGATKGGAIKLKLADPATLINNIVAWSETHNGIFVEDDCDNVEIGYTCFHDNGVNIEEQQAGDVTEHHTLQGDPDPLIVCGFHLADGSPCRDAGDNGAFVSGDKDIDGHDRIINDVIDIGADEYVADVDGDGCVDDTDLAMVLTAFGFGC